MFTKIRAVSSFTRLTALILYITQNYICKLLKTIDFMLLFYVI